MRTRHGALGLIGLFLLCSAILGLRSISDNSRHDRAARKLHPLPSLDDHNETTLALLEKADRVLRADPSSRQARERMAQLYHAYQFYDEAAALYRDLIEHQPPTFRLFYYLAALEESRQNWEEAASLYRRAATLRSGDADSWARFASTLVKLGRLQEARMATDRAFAIDPNHPIAGYLKARAIGAEGDWSESVRILNGVIECYPRASDCHKLLSRAFMELGQEEAAKRHAELGSSGEAYDSPMMQELFALSLPALLDGNAARGRGLVEERCRKCHTLRRTFQHPDETKLWWAGTVRRMQRLAGKSLLTDDEAADAVAYLATARDSLPVGRKR